MKLLAPNRFALTATDAATVEQADPIQDTPWLLISIRSYDTAPVKLPDDPNRRAVLFLTFDDLRRAEDAPPLAAWWD